MASLNLKDRLAGVKDSFANMNKRERLLVTALVAAFGLVLFFLFYYLISDGLDRREERCLKARKALELLARHADELTEARLAEAKADARIEKTAPMLQGHLHSIAESTKIDVKEYKQLKPRLLDKSKRYRERSIRLRIYRVELEPLTRFMDQIESGRHLIMITQLDIQTRPRQHELLDVDMVVSTYEKVTEKETEKTKGKKNAKGGDKKGKRKT